MIIQVMTFSNRIKCLVKWFDIKAGGLTVYTGSLAGSSEQYFVQGGTNSYTTYTIDWEAGSATNTKTVTIGTTTNINTGGRITGDGTDNAVFISRTIYRFNAKPGEPDNAQEYPIVSGQQYAYPRSAYNTVYVFIGCTQCLITKTFYRVQSDSTNDVKQFDVNDESRAYGVLIGTPWLLVSFISSNQRKLFDYTNGYTTGSNSVTETHIKTGQSNELGFMSPQDGRGYYNTFTFSSKILYTIKVVDGSEHLNYPLTLQLGNYATSLMWVFDTDLVAITGGSLKVVLVDFMDTAKTRTVTIVSIPNSGKF